MPTAINPRVNVPTPPEVPKFEPWEYRLFEETAALQKKILDLTEYLNRKRETDVDFDSDGVQLLIAQKSAMETYFNILIIRIEGAGYSYETVKQVIK